MSDLYDYIKKKISDQVDERNLDDGSTYKEIEDYKLYIENICFKYRQEFIAEIYMLIEKIKEGYMNRIYKQLSDNDE